MRLPSLRLRRHLTLNAPLDTRSHSQRARQTQTWGIRSRPLTGQSPRAGSPWLAFAAVHDLTCGTMAGSRCGEPALFMTVRGEIAESRREGDPLPFSLQWVRVEPRRREAY